MVVFPVEVFLWIHHMEYYIKRNLYQWWFYVKQGSECYKELVITENVGKRVFWIFFFSQWFLTCINSSPNPRFYQKENICNVCSKYWAFQKFAEGDTPFSATSLRRASWSCDVWHNRDTCTHISRRKVRKSGKSSIFFKITHLCQSICCNHSYFLKLRGRILSFTCAFLQMERADFC